MNYRTAARKSLNRAKTELDSSDNNRLRYAALELRMAIESLVYERAAQFSQELSGKKLNTWQPKKLLSLLLELDPYADQSGTISFGAEEEPGKPPRVMTTLGRERVLSLIDIKKYYDRLGSYLHAPTLEQLENKTFANTDKTRKSCNEIFTIIKEVLDSTVFNVSLKLTTTKVCDKCGNEIIRRVPTDAKPFTAACINCSATYQLTLGEDKKVYWNPKHYRMKCANSSCSEEEYIWASDIQPNAAWTCKGCGGANVFQLTVVHQPKINPPKG